MRRNSTVSFRKVLFLSRGTAHILFLFFLFFIFWGVARVAVSLALTQQLPSRLPVNLHGTFFFTEEEGWVVGQLGKIFHTVDGGKNWEEQRSGTNVLLTAVAFADRTHGWVVGERGVILHSEDRGVTWMQQ